MGDRSNRSLPLFAGRKQRCRLPATSSSWCRRYGGSRPELHLLIIDFIFVYLKVIFSIGQSSHSLKLKKMKCSACPVLWVVAAALFAVLLTTTTTGANSSFAPAYHGTPPSPYSCVFLFIKIYFPFYSFYVLGAKTRDCARPSWARSWTRSSSGPRTGAHCTAYSCARSRAAKRRRCTRITRPRSSRRPPTPSCSRQLRSSCTPTAPRTSAMSPRSSSGAARPSCACAAAATRRSPTPTWSALLQGTAPRMCQHTAGPVHCSHPRAYERSQQDQEQRRQCVGAGGGQLAVQGRRPAVPLYSLLSSFVRSLGTEHGTP